MNTKASHTRKSVRARAAVVIAVLSFMALALITASCTGPKPAEPAGESVSGADSVVYDLYVMSMCPFGFTAVAELSEVLRAFPRRTLNVWFIGRVDGGRLTSMRGEPEVEDETLWLGVKALYPARYREFLAKRGVSRDPTEDVLKGMKLDVGKIRAWAADEGRAELREHYIRSVDQSITASPTLYIDGSRYYERVGGGELVRSVCAGTGYAPQFCREYPECSEDAQCSKTGQVGKCAYSGKRAVCEYWDDTVFALTALTADSAMDNPEMLIIQWIERTFPGADTRTVKFSSDEGRQLVERYNPDALPFFHFDRAVEGAYRFAMMRERLDTVEAGGYKLKNEVIRPNYFPRRPEKPGLIEVYVDPLSFPAGRVINIILADTELARRVVLRPSVIAGVQNQTPVLHKLRTEEALRWIVLADEFPKSYQSYLKRYAADPGSTYWFNWLKDININQERFMRSIEAAQPKMASYRDDLAAVSAGEPVMVLVNNRAKLPVLSEQDFERVLKSMF
ncbi:MAG: hypothetical protein FWB94_10975 [Chitinispirillia bacterium]|nr:hypothetical protein [Chitinispirillia bacterium]